MEELALLAETAGAEVLSRMVQQRAAPDPAFYIGKGKAQELAEAVEMSGAGLVIFNDELSPSQVRNLDRILDAKIVDRTALILDIFARRARSRAGKLQVELAQLHYLLPRLTGLGRQLDPGRRSWRRTAAPFESGWGIWKKRSAPCAATAPFTGGSAGAAAAS